MRKDTRLTPCVFFVLSPHILIKMRKGGFMAIRISSVLRQLPHAVAIINGSEEYPSIHGIVRFYGTDKGVLVAAKVSGLPQGDDCRQPVFGFHIHAGDACSGNADDPFAVAGTHYNPLACPHPYHAGDLPPLFGCNGEAVSVTLTDRFNIKEIIGRTVILHASPDDFTSQPAGNAGVKMACGEIRPVRR